MGGVDKDANSAIRRNCLTKKQSYVRPRNGDWDGLFDELKQLKSDGTAFNKVNFNYLYEKYHVGATRREFFKSIYEKGDNSTSADSMECRNKIRSWTKRMLRETKVKKTGISPDGTANLIYTAEELASDMTDEVLIAEIKKRGYKIMKQEWKEI